MNRRPGPDAKRRSRRARLTSTPRSLRIAIVSRHIPDVFHLAKRALCTWGLLALLGAPASANEYGRPLFRWVDAKGTVRYTPYPGEVPRSRRPTLERVEAGIGAEWSPQPASDLPAVGAGATSATSGVPPAEDPAGPPGELEAAIARLEASIARDQALLENLISDPETAETLEDSADLSAIAERLPRQQANLQALLERRGR